MRATAARMRRDLILLATVFATAAAATAQEAAVDPDATRMAIRQLRRATVIRRDGRHLLLLSSLRQLHDPATRPLFDHLLTHPEWQVQVHAALGLAETAPDGRLDPGLVRRVDRRAQEAILTNAIDLELLDVDGIRDLLAWQELGDLPRLLLAAELVLAGEAPDIASLHRLADSPRLEEAGLAAVLLAQLGDAGLFSAYADRLDGLAAMSRRRRVEWLIEAIRQYRLTEAVPWVERQLEPEDVHPAVASVAVVTLLQLDPARGVAAWTRRLGPEPSHVEQVRMGLLLLESDIAPPAAALDRLTGSDPLIRAMVESGHAISTGGDVAEALIRLIDVGQMRAAAWALRRAGQLSPPAAARVYAHVIEHVQDHHHGRSEWADMSVTATARLFEIDPDAVAQLLAAADDDSLKQQTILLGLLASESPRAGELARGVRRIGAGQTDSMALLLLAKHQPELSEDDLDELALVVRGGGRVSDVLQTQAAWLYLRSTGLVGPALSELFDSAAGP